jgi:hypothetical protein
MLATTSCGVHGLSLVQDRRVDVVRPNERSKVELPVTVQWTVKDFPVGPGAGSFGVLVDRAPPPSGKPLAWLVRGEAGCEGPRAATCARSEFLAQHNIFQTNDTSFRVDQVDKLTGSQAGRQFHEVTVVLLGADGERVGEGAWPVQFEVKDKG